MVPLSKPIIAVLVIFTFMWRWNDFALPLVVLTDQERFTLPLGLNLLRGQANPDWALVMALALISLLPMVLIFVISSVISSRASPGQASRSRAFRPSRHRGTDMIKIAMIGAGSAVFVKNLLTDILAFRR